MGSKVKAIAILVSVGIWVSFVDKVSCQEMSLNVSELFASQSEERSRIEKELSKARQEVIASLLKIAEDRPGEEFQPGDPRVIAISLLAEYRAAEAVPFLLKGIDRVPADVKGPKPSDFPCVAALIRIGKPASKAAAIELARTAVSPELQARGQLVVYVITQIEGEEIAEAMIEKAALKEEGYPEARSFLCQRAGERRVRLMRGGQGKRIYVVSGYDRRDILTGLAVEFARTGSIVQPSIVSADTEASALGAFFSPIIGDAATSQPISVWREILLLAGRPSEKALEVNGKKWAELNPQEYLLAGRGVGIAVHSQCKLDSLTVAQVQQIFSGQVTDWKVLGEQSGRIAPYVLNPSNAVQPIFAKEVLPADKWAGIKQVKDTAAALSAVSMDRNAIAFVDLAAMPESGQSVKLLSIDIGGRAFAPTAENIRSGSYPLAERLFLYVHPKASDTAKDFAKFMATCGASEANPYQDTYAAVSEAYRKNGWLPLAPKPTTRPAYRLPTTRPISVTPASAPAALRTPTTMPAAVK